MAQAERLWEANKSETSRLSLREQLDYQSKLRKQFPLASERVVYTKSGQHLAACRIDEQDAVIDHTLYWATVASAEEGRYVCSVLNSQALTELVVGLQARGQHNPRHFDMHVFAFGLPAFDAHDETHARLAALGERAEDVAAAVDVDSCRQFQKARRVTRDALREDGVAEEIDLAVDELIADASVPDLMAALSGAADTAQRRSKAVRPGRTPIRSGNRAGEPKAHTDPR